MREPMSTAAKKGGMAALGKGIPDERGSPMYSDPATT